MANWVGKVSSDGAAGKTIKGLFDDSLSQQLSTQQQTDQWQAGDIVSVSVSVSVGNSLQFLASADSALATVYQTLAELGLNPHHPQDCYHEARGWLEDPGLDDPSLQDLTHLPFVTIDNEDSKDLDQAVYAEAPETGLEKPGSSREDCLQVFYALADASYYVRPGSALFEEAMKRAVTYYTPVLSVPMLPRELSEDLVSLNPNVVRRAVVFVMDIDRQGELISTTIQRARIQSVAKLSYAGVQQFYDADNGATHHPYSSRPFAESLRLLRETGLRRLQHAEKRNVVEYNRSEASVGLLQSSAEAANSPSVAAQTSPASMRKKGFVISLRNRLDSEQYNEQVSLMCNMEGARLLKQHSQNSEELQSIFRIHSPPLETRLQDLQTHIEQLSHLHALDPVWIWDGETQLADYLQTITSIVDHEQPALAPILQSIERLILLTNRASFFSAEPGPHHALGVDVYARFSSPMREMVGIFTHKELLDCLDLQSDVTTSPNALSSADSDRVIRRSIIEKANQAKKLQKKLDQEFRLFAIDDYLHHDLTLGEQQRPARAGTIMGIRRGRVYVSLDGFGIDIKLYLSDLSEHFQTQYVVDGLTAVPESAGPKAGSNPVLKVGQRINIRVNHFDKANRRFILLPVTR